MRIGILGSGLMGGKLGTIFARAGHDVVFSYSRSERKLKRLAREARGHARAGTPREAAVDADAVLLAVHWSRVDDVLRQVGDLAGRVVVSCSLPMNADDTALVVAHTSSGAEVLARKLRKAHVVSAFGTVPSEVFLKSSARRSGGLAVGRASSTAGRPGRERDRNGYSDSGCRLRTRGRWTTASRRYLEPFSLAVAQLAYEGDNGPEVAYRIEHFKSRA